MKTWEMPAPPGSDTGQPPAKLWDAEGVEWTPVFPDATEWIEPRSGERVEWRELLYNYGPLTDEAP